MVLVGAAQFGDHYVDVRQRWSGGGRVPVQCIVGGDVDSLCTLRVLMQLLISDKVHPVVTPVGNPAAVVQALSEIPTKGRVTVFLINCGGAMRLDEYLPAGDIAVHLIDPHRPHHLENVTSANVKVWQDGDIERHLRVCQQRKRRRAPRTRGAPGDAGDQEERRRRRRRRREGSDGSYDPAAEDDEGGDESEASIDLEGGVEDGGAEEDSFGDEYDDEDDGVRGEEDEESGSSNEGDGEAKLRLLKGRYYRGTWWGAPSCTLMQGVASKFMSVSPDDLLWLSAVSVAHFFTTGKMGHEAYRTHLNDQLYEIAQSNLVKPKTERAGEDGLEYTAFHSIRLERCVEHQLFLLRHLSLWEALLLSPFVASRLQLYNTEHGVNTLRQIVHGRLGLKEDECKTEWLTFANHARRDEILEALAGHFSQMGCASFSGESVLMRQGYGEGVSACDMASIVQAMLTFPPAQAPPAPQAAQQRQEQEEREGKHDDSRDKAADAAYLESFYNAYDALDYTKLAATLRASVEKARSAQSALMRQAAALLQKEYVRSVGHFRYAFLNEASTDLPFFLHPLALSSLARAVAETLAEAARIKASKKGDVPKKQTPLVLLALEKATSLYTIVPCMPSNGDTEEEVHNPFGNYLRASMEEVDVTLAAKNHQFAGQAGGVPQPDPSAGGGAATSEPLGGREVGFDFTTGMKVHRRDIRGVIDALVLKFNQSVA